MIVITLYTSTSCEKSIVTCLEVDYKTSLPEFKRPENRFGWNCWGIYL